MTLLLSAPQPSAAWRWEFEFQGQSGIDVAASKALVLSRLLEEVDLLHLGQVEVLWYVPKREILKMSSVISLKDGADTSFDELVHLISTSRPSGHPGAFAGRLNLSGHGAWMDKQGQRRAEQRLVDISLSIHSKEIWVSLMVRHDIWSFYDFSGNPHPEIYEKNAPRLTAALKAIENELDAETVEGEPTFFAEPEQYGIAIDEPDENGKGVDSTMFL